MFFYTLYDLYFLKIRNENNFYIKYDNSYMKKYIHKLNYSIFFNIILHLS